MDDRTAQKLLQRLDQLEHGIAALRREVEILLGVELAPSDTREPLSPNAKKKLKQQQATRARAAKAEGKGRGRLSPAAKRKAERDLKKLEGKG